MKKRDLIITIVIVLLLAGWGIYMYKARVNASAPANYSVSAPGILHISGQRFHTGDTAVSSGEENEGNMKLS